MSAPGDGASALLTVEFEADGVGDGLRVVVVVAEAGELGAEVRAPQRLHLHRVARLAGRDLLVHRVDHHSVAPPRHAAVRPTCRDREMRMSYFTNIFEIPCSCMFVLEFELQSVARYE